MSKIIVENLVEKYIKSICLEIENWKKRINVNQYNVTTIYIGGGTPSYIESKYMHKNKAIEITYSLQQEIETKANIEIF